MGMMDEAKIVEAEEGFQSLDDAVEPDQSGVKEDDSDKEQWQILLQENRQALAKDPRNVRLLLEVGEIAEAAGDIERATWAYKRAIRLEPDFASAYRNLGHLYERQGRKKAAADALQNYLRYADADVDESSTLSTLQELLGRDDEEISMMVDESPLLNLMARKWGELGLTPGEAIYLMDPENSSGREMMRYTLLDMVMRGVLEQDADHAVGKGELYGEVILQPHEVIFAKYFASYDDLIDLRRLARAVTRELSSRLDNYKSEYVRRTLEWKGFMQKETYRIGRVLPARRYVLTKKGVRASHRLRRLMKEAGRQIDRSVKNNPQQARAYFSEGGPAILLMESFPPGYFQEWIDTLEYIGLGPTVQRARSGLQRDSGDVVSEILKVIIGD
jgi:tetratricopeptide (TPR) repeat protein